MERLTKKYSNGYGGLEYITHPNEDIPMQLKILKAFEKLGKLEDLEEQLGMPLDVFFDLLIGDKEHSGDIYAIRNGAIGLYECDGFHNGCLYDKNYETDEDKCMTFFSPKEYGEKWFITHEEAKKKLEEMKNEKG